MHTLLSMFMLLRTGFGIYLIAGSLIYHLLKLCPDSIITLTEIACMLGEWMYETSSTSEGHKKYIMKLVNILITAMKSKI